MYKYLGPVELQDNSGEYHVYEIVQTDKYIIFGTSCNTGLIEHGRMSIGHDFSIDMNLQELISDLEVMINDGEQYTSYIEYKPFK